MLSPKETTENKNEKSVQEMASFILINDIVTYYSKMLDACNIYLTLLGTVAIA